jgi:hypothetical protein
MWTLYVMEKMYLWRALCNILKKQVFIQEILPVFFPHMNLVPKPEKLLKIIHDN